MMLCCDGLSKRFGGVQALEGVSFEVRAGEIVGLIGPNGAGKSVLFGVLSGVHRPEAGRAIFQERDLTTLGPSQVARLGIGRANQIVRPLDELTVRENVMVGACFGRAGCSRREAAKQADDVLALVGLADRAEQLAASLNIAQKKRLETARAVAGQPHLLLLDETLAGLNPTEIAEMLTVIRALRDQGLTVIMVEHVMQAVMNIAERLLVLDHGHLIAEGDPQTVVQETHVIEAYLGDARLAAGLLPESESMAN